MLQVFLALGPTVGTFLRRLVRCGYICELSLSQWTISLHFITTVRFGFVCIQNVPFSSWRKHKDGWPLLHCSIISIIRIPRWQNMFTELINVLDLTFIQVYNPLLWNLLRTPNLILSLLLSIWLHANYLSEFSRYSKYILQVWWTKLQSLIFYF